MNPKKYICLALFILPILGMIAILWNYVSPVTSTIQSSNPLTPYTNSVDSWDSSVTPVKSEWITKEIGGRETTYKLGRDFRSCDISEKIETRANDGRLRDPLGTINRVDFLENLLWTHCIDYTQANIQNLVFDDVASDDTRAKQVIKTAMDLWIAKGYNENWVRVFKANQDISKIEALAIILDLSKIQLKDKAATNNFIDVENNWKAGIADIAHRLQLTPIDESRNMFFPEYKMKRGDTFNMLGKIAQYY